LATEYRLPVRAGAVRLAAVISVPGPVRAKAESVGAGAWLTGLPDLIARLQRQWSVQVGRGYPDGTEAYVAEAVCADGTPAVVKLMVPRGSGPDLSVEEVTVLRLAAGDGCARLLRFDEPAGALLLERLGPSLSTLDVPCGQRLEILADVAARVWRPAAGVALPTGARKARRQIDAIRSGWEAAGRPCAGRTVEHAVACGRRRIAAHDPARAVLVHGDVHQWNTLRAGDSWKLVDPDGALAEPEYDLGVLMREDLPELMAGDPWDRAHWLAARTGTDATAIWEWGVLERVSNGLTCLRDGLAAAGRLSLAAADTIAQAEARHRGSFRPLPPRPQASRA
jgi:streptomycin 6-kinase